MGQLRDRLPLRLQRRGKQVLVGWNQVQKSSLTEVNQTITTKATFVSSSSLYDTWRLDVNAQYCDRTTTGLWNDKSIHDFARPATILCRQNPGAAKEIALPVDLNEESEELGDQSISGAAKAIKAGRGLGALAGNLARQLQGLLKGSQVLETVRPTSKTRALLVSSQCRV